MISGTSADAIDVAVVEVTRRCAGVASRTLAAAAVPYTAARRDRVLGLCRADAPLEEVCAANFEVGEWFAEAAIVALRGAGLSPSEVDLVGSHGQTIWHIPGHSTMQIGEAAVLAERLGVPVVSNFRAREMAAGGAGAPLVAYVDLLLFRDERRARAVQNLGGIGNVTWIPAGATGNDVVSFDTGPANMIVDGLMRIAFGRELDAGGEMSRRGTVCEPLLRELLADPYYSAPPPKTTGREKYGHAYARGVLERARALGATAEDAVATAAALTVRTIADAYRRFLPPPDDVIVGGGGVHNAAILDGLRRELAPSRVATTAEYGIAPDFKEAIAFAILAAEHVWGRPGNLPSATGARRRVVLGDFTPAV
jgi:anhydro-N-acetylmuramic acid kinase